jgi:hypothetical protein
MLFTNFGRLEEAAKTVALLSRHVERQSLMTHENSKNDKE